jgi:predicted DNA-binding transcriptional regulator YafY
MKVDRMLGILTFLMSKPRVKSKELAERFEVSVRTIYRDIDAIGKAGIPIITYPGGEGGIGIADGFTLDKSVLTRDELKNIVLGLKSLGSVITDSQINSLLGKLSPESPCFTNCKDDLQFDLASYYRDSLAPKINLLRRAMAEKTVISFSYYSKKGHTRRDVEPYLITFQWSAWYLFGYCRLREDFRLFKLNRIAELKLLNLQYEPRRLKEKQFDFGAYLSDPETMQHATLLLDRSLEYVIVDEYGPDFFEVVDENRIVAKWDYVDEHEMIKTILGMGSGVKILSPQRLADGVRDEAEKIFQQYG